MFDYILDAPAAIRDLGIESSSLEFKQQVILKLQEQLDKKMGLRIQGEMTDEDLQKFDELTNQGDEPAQAWLENRFPNHKAMYDEELAQLVQVLRRSMDAAAGPN